MNAIPLLARLAVVCLVLPLAAFAQKGGATKVKSDPRVATALAAADLKFETDGDGDYRMVIRVDDERTQLVYVNTRTETYSGLEIREVWAIGGQTAGDFSADIANRLLEDNHLRKIGAWAIRTLNSKPTAVFVAKIPAVVSAEELKTTIQAVIATADEIEKKHFGGDEF